MLQIAPSILSADFTALGGEVAAVERGGADLIHVDVMDGHFVPNITIGPLVVRALKRTATKPLDVHLMIEEPDRFIAEFVRAGANMVSVHVEAVPHLHRTVQLVKGLGAQAGVVLNPSTPASALEDIAADVDFVLVMSVNPGFGGQVFIPQTLDKLRRVREVLSRTGSAALIEIDGGIGPVERRAGGRGRGFDLGGRKCHLRYGRPRAGHAGAPGGGHGSGYRLSVMTEGVASGPERQTRVRVRYADTDRMGVAYYANYLVWFEVARTEWFRQTGTSYREVEGEGISLPVIEAHCAYRRAARYDDELEIRTRATLLTPARRPIRLSGGSRGRRPGPARRGAHRACRSQRSWAARPAV